MKSVLVFLGELFNFVNNLRVQNLALLAILFLLIWLLIVNRRLKERIKSELEDIKYQVKKIDDKLEQIRKEKEN